MKPLFQASMLNGPFEDPVLFVDFLFERRALLFDVGSVRVLPTRKILRLTDIFVSHTHMDHFNDLDWVLRICLGRPLSLRLYGPEGLIDRVEHKLAAYTWNLVHNYDTDLNLQVVQLQDGGRGRRACFRLQTGFTREDEAEVRLSGGVLLREPGFEVRAEILDHEVPCLGFRVDEHRHVNIWKDRLEARGLRVGPWLRELKSAVLEGRPDSMALRASWKDGDRTIERELTLGELRRDVLHVTPGQKIAYVVDAGYTAANRDRIRSLAREVDTFFCEAAFLDEEAERALQRRHLTARQAGALAREAGVKQLVPIHFSPRHSDQEQALRCEASLAFEGRDRDGRDL
ncbi:MAG: MBL fold metallo-hydrolase [Chromatiales bacterium]